jgi:hypothetical protein
MAELELEALELPGAAGGEEAVSVYAVFHNATVAVQSSLSRWKVGMASLRFTSVSSDVP